MALVVPNGAETFALSYFVGKTTTAEPLTLRLFTNNVTPGETDVVGTFTEATGVGYAAVPLTGASWTITPGAPTSAANAQQTFTFTGSLGNVYGYYLTRTTTGDLAYAERFSDGPYAIANNGDQIKITPTITMD